MAQYSDMPGWMAEVFGYQPQRDYGTRQRYLSKTPSLPQARRPTQARLAPPISPAPRSPAQPIIPDFSTTVTPEPEAAPSSPAMLQTMRQMIPQPENQWQANPNLPPDYRFGREQSRSMSEIVSSIVDYLGKNTLPQAGGDLMELLNNIRDANIQRRTDRQNLTPIPNLLQPPPLQQSNQDINSRILNLLGGGEVGGSPQQFDMTDQGDFNRFMPGGQ